ncbi:unnamed protein product, partial [Ilex paraguariensis]
DGNSGSKERNNIDWDTDDEIEIMESVGTSSCSGPIFPSRKAIAGSMEIFVMIGESNAEAVLESLLTFSALENLAQEKEDVSNEPCSSKPESVFKDEFSNVDSCPRNEEHTDQLLKKDMALSLLMEMGYQAEEALTAIERCG